LDEKLMPKTARGKAFFEFCDERGGALMLFATFQVLHSYFMAQGKSSNWQDWPKEYHSATSNAVKKFQKEYQESILYIKYQQFVAYEQYDEMAGICKRQNLFVGLYTDLPVGVGGNSADVWADKESYVPGVSVGAPPDMFNEKGQDWSLAAFHPIRLKQNKYAPFIAVLKSIMLGAGAMRLDHAFSLMRLFIQVKGASGAYLSYPFADLAGILALESVRHKCMIICEDLGTPPPHFYDLMRAYKTFSFRLFRYQRNGDNFTPPGEYDRQSLVTPGTHDMPTYSAFWKGLDLDLFRELKIIPPQKYENDRAARDGERYAFIRAFSLQGLDTTPQEGAVMPTWFIPNTYAYLARSNSAVVLVRLEDIFEQDEQVNVPGTFMEYPNWRYKVPVEIENMQADERFAAISKIMKKERL
jgi:4-alpha-glucanotransferase